MGSRIYLVMSRKAGQAYIGKGPDDRIDGEHNDAFHEILKMPDVIQWESKPFDTERDALIAEAAAIGIVKNFEIGMSLVNIQQEYQERFSPRYPIPFMDGDVKASDLPNAIIVTISPDRLHNDDRVAPNSPWKAEELAERVRKYWRFSRERAELWASGKGSPDVLVAVAQGSKRILAVFEIDNARWLTDGENSARLEAVPLKDRSEPNANGMQGKRYVGKRQGGAVTYGSAVG